MCPESRLKNDANFTFYFYLFLALLQHLLVLFRRVLVHRLCLLCLRLLISTPLLPILLLLLILASSNSASSSSWFFILFVVFFLIYFLLFFFFFFLFFSSSSALPLTLPLLFPHPRSGRPFSYCVCTTKGRLSSYEAPDDRSQALSTELRTSIFALQLYEHRAPDVRFRAMTLELRSSGQPFAGAEY